MLFSCDHLGFVADFVIFFLLTHLYFSFADEAAQLVHKEGADHQQQQQLLVRRLDPQLMQRQNLRVALEAIGGASETSPPSPHPRRLPSQNQEARKYLLQSVF